MAKDAQGHGSDVRGGSSAVTMQQAAHQSGVVAATKPNSKIESYKGISSVMARERMTVKQFQSRDAMHGFLNKGSNSLSWREHTAGFKPGTYARAGGQWHNVKSLDPTTLAHI